VLLAACGSASDSGGRSTGSASSGPVPATVATTTGGGSETTSVVGAATAPPDTLSDEVVPGPPALTVVGPDGAVRWQAPPTAGFMATMQAAVGDGVIVGATFCDGPVAVKGWDQASGAPLWSAVVPGSQAGAATVAESDGLALVATADGLDALDARTGQPLWHRERTILWAGSHRAILVSDGDPQSSSGSNLLALDPSGGTRWTADIGSRATIDGVALDGSRAYATVYADQQQQVAAFALTDGRELWRVPLSAGSDRSVVEAPGDVAVGWPTDMVGVAVAALDGATGAERWRVGGFGLPHEAQGVTFSGDGAVYVSSFDGGAVLAALDAGTGAVRWSRSAADLGVSNLSAVSAADGGLLVVANRDMAMLGATDGTEQWRHAPPGGLLTTSGGVLTFGPGCPNPAAD
jgi:outer membrane protein assembly factor BamB